MPRTKTTSSTTSSDSGGSSSSSSPPPHEHCCSDVESIRTEGGISSCKHSSHSTSKECSVAGSIAVYWIFVSLIPIYNKFYFRKDLYPYPIATAGIQLAVVALLLALWNTGQHYYYIDYNNTRNIQESFNNDNIRQWQQRQDSENSLSWIFGPHFWWKLKWCTPIGVLFGLKYGVTNWGLKLVPAPTHLLLQSTDLVWTVLGAWLINGEHVRRVEMLCLVGCITGSFVLSWNHIIQQAAETASTAPTIPQSLLSGAPLFAIGVNLLSPILLGLCISTLRLACKELMNPNNRLGGSVTSVELTCIKLIISSMVATLLATLFESASSNVHEYSWWYSFFVDVPSSTRWGVVGGAVLIAIFQVNCTFLTYLTSAVSVGLVGQVKIIPQWIVATIFAKLTSDFELQSMNLVGAILIMISAAAFCVSNHYHYYHDENNNNEDVMEEEPATDSEEATRLLNTTSQNGLQASRSSSSQSHSTMPLLTKTDEWATEAEFRSNYDTIL